jgi:hypothetical protein
VKELKLARGARQDPLSHSWLTWICPAESFSTSSIVRQLVGDNLLNIKGISMAISELLVFGPFAYLIWAIFVSESFFHRVWSLALCSLEASVFLLF